MATVTTPGSQHRNIQVYFLAAPEDEAVCEDIIKHLKPIIRSSPIPIEVDSDFNIPGGADKEKYKQRLFEANIVLALISVDFIDNDEIYSRNQKVIDRYNNHETIMIPILVRNCMWKATPYRSLPVVPKNLQPLNNKQFWNSEDDALMAVVSDIYDSINELAKTPSAAVQPLSAAKMESAPDLKAPSGTSIRQAEPSKVMTELPQPPSGAMQPSSAAKVESTPDLKATLVTPGQATSQARASSPIAVDWREKYYRTVLLKRAGAILLDQFFLFLAPFFLIGFVAGITGQDVTLSDAATWTIVLAMYFVIAPLMESSKWQGTIGKRIMKLQITNREGERIPFLRALWRNIMRTVVLYSYIFVVPLVIQYFRFNKTRKLFHDELSGTAIGERLASSGAVEVAANAA